MEKKIHDVHIKMSHEEYIALKTYALHQGLTMTQLLIGSAFEVMDNEKKYQ